MRFSGYSKLCRTGVVAGLDWTNRKDNETEKDEETSASNCRSRRHGHCLLRRPARLHQGALGVAQLFQLSYLWLFVMLCAEIVSFACAATLLRILLRTKLWFSVVAALLVGNAVTNVLPAGDVAGAGVQFQMLSMGGIDAAQAGGGLAVSAIIGLAGLFILPVCAVPAILGGVPISPGLEHAAILGIVGFVLIVGAGAILLTTDRPLMKLASGVQRSSMPYRSERK